MCVCVCVQHVCRGDKHGRFFWNCCLNPPSETSCNIYHNNVFTSHFETPSWLTVKCIKAFVCARACVHACVSIWVLQCVCTCDHLRACFSHNGGKKVVIVCRKSPQQQIRVVVFMSTNRGDVPNHATMSVASVEGRHRPTPTHQPCATAAARGVRSQAFSQPECTACLYL